MSYPIEFPWRGLAVEAEIDECRGSYYEPPSGGAEDIRWTVDDIDEVLEYLDIESRGVEQMVRACFKYTGKLPAILVSKVDAWNITDAALDYWNDIGGMKDYNYDG